MSIILDGTAGITYPNSVLQAGGVSAPATIAQGGTGQTTATAAFNALNPMTTTGDIMYEASATTAARLPIGTSGQLLTVSGGLPAWVAAPSSTPTTAQVGTASAGFAVGDLGTYAYLGTLSSSTGLTNGTNYAGSSLQYAGVSMGSNAGYAGTNVGCISDGDTAFAASGTWKCMGANNVYVVGSGRGRSTLFLRVA